MKWDLSAYNIQWGYLSCFRIKPSENRHQKNKKSPNKSKSSNSIWWIVVTVFVLIPLRMKKIFKLRRNFKNLLKEKIYGFCYQYFSSAAREAGGNQTKPNMDCNYTFPIHLAPNGFSFGVTALKKRLWSSWNKFIKLHYELSHVLKLSWRH